jgi:protein-S-isoprenylcysteine O-methyltransferase Ste14
MSLCRKRLILWLVLVGISAAAGILTDLLLRTPAFPAFVRLLGLAGVVLAHFPLKRSGKLLALLGESKEWGCTTRLVTIDIYQCVRHPHHMAIGIFMTCLALLVGHVWSFLMISITQWMWVIGFLILVEERELLRNFGEEYQAYRQKVPMLFPKPECAFRVLTQPLGGAKKQSGLRKDTRNEASHRERKLPSRMEESKC